MIKKLLSTGHGEIASLEFSILIFRIGASALILTHGIPKMMKVISGDMAFIDPIGLGPEISLILAAFAEGICGILLLLGLWSRPASFVLTLNMAVAVFFAHAGDPFSRKEKAVLFLLIFFVLFLTGAGKYSLDHKFYGKGFGFTRTGF